MSFTCFIIGEDTLTVQCGNVLLRRGHKIFGLVSQAPQIRRWARERNVQLIDPRSDLKSALGEHPFDYLFSVANLRLLRKELVALPRTGTINFHDGPLPRYAGIHATSWALMNRERMHGVTWHFISDVVDGGKILKQRMIEISENETAFSLNAKCFEAGIETFSELIDELTNGAQRPKEQDSSIRTYFGKWQRPTAAGIISWRQSAEEITALVRALDLGPYPNAIGRAKIAFGAGFMVCTELEVLGHANGAVPGTITAIEPEQIRVATATGVLGFRRLQTLFGQTLSAKQIVEQYGLRPGMNLPEPNHVQRDRITKLNNEICRSERFWLRRLSSLHPFSLPYLEPTNTAQESTHINQLGIAVTPEMLGSVSALWPAHMRAELLVGAFLLYLARLGDEGRFDLGLRWEGLSEACAGLDALFATEVPCRVAVDLTMPVRDEMAQVLELLETTRSKKTYLCDLWTRWPELRTVADKTGVPTFPFRVEFVETITRRAWPPESHVAFFAAEDGCCLVYSPSALKVENARLMAEQFRSFFKALCREPEKCVAALPLLTDSEQNQILFGWNDNAVPVAYDKCKPELFEEQVKETPTAVALAFKEEQLTYTDLNTRANQLARHLCKLGVGPDVVVGICVERSIEMVVALLGIQKAGGAYLPLDPTYPKDRLAFIMQDAKIRVLMTQDRLTASLPPNEAKMVRVDADWAAIGREESTNFKSQLQPHNLAYVIYTSGSTGKPKGVMVEQGNVVSFFTGMDARVPHQQGDVWLAVTSLSFDISVLELFWTLCRGFKVVLYPDDQRTCASALRPSNSARSMDYGLFYFSADQGEHPSKKYRLLIEGAKFADENGFVAVWTPERHFHEFGGLYPNPSVTGAALAMITKRLQIRSGSVVAPLHSPIRIAEEWSVVDNLSDGRAAVSFASGWMPEDFVIRDDDFATRKDATFRHIEMVRRLWRGDTVAFPGPLGQEVSVRTLPRPIQAELPVWVTTAGNPETYALAAKVGANVLTHLLGQSIEEVGRKIALYRKTWKQAGYSGRGRVALMLHTFLGENAQAVKETVRQPLIAYLRTSADLLKKYSWAFPTFKNQGLDRNQMNFGDLPPKELEAVLDFAFDRYFETSGLFGTPDTCLEFVDKLKAHDVDEIACLIDFGVPTEVVLANLNYLNTLRAATSGSPSGDEIPSADYTIGALIRRHGVTHLQCTPSMARMLLAEDDTQAALSRLQNVMIGGEAFPTALASELKKVVNGRIINMYGPTETTIWSGTHELGTDTLSVPIGRPIPNTQFYVVNRFFQPQPVGVPGELLIGGAGVARGYLNRSDLTAERFVPNPFIPERNARVYRTGDLVRYLPNGNLEFLGRLDYQVKIRGYRIELGEIEAVLNKHSLVREAVVVAREDTPGDMRLVAYVTMRNAQKIDAAELRDFVQAHLPDYMVPARVVQLETFPQTPNQKIDRKALPPPDHDAVGQKRHFEPPQGAVEKTLAEIWAGLLGIREIGRRDDFFALGGDSLTLVQFTLKSEQAFGRKVSIGAFVQARTLERVSKLVETPVAEDKGMELEQQSVPTPTVKVRRMCEADLDEVIEIHLDYFPHWRVTMLGRRFLRKMYRWFMKEYGDLALVAARDGHVTGFTVGSIGPYKKSLFFHALPEVVYGIASNPARVIQDSLSRVRGLYGREHLNNAPNDPEMKDRTLANNRIMALSKSANGGGLDLILAFEKAAERRGTKAYFHDWNAKH